MSFKKDDWVAFKHSLGTTMCQVLAVYDDMVPPALRINRHGVEWTVKQEECEPWADYMDRQNRKKIAAAKENCADVIRAFEAGHRDIKAIAAILGVVPQKVTAKFLQAKRYKFIEVEEPQLPEAA